jgi:hypothetical protein
MLLYIKNKILPVSFAFLLLVLYSSCSGAKPEVMFLSSALNLVYDRDLDRSYEQLSVNIKVNDDDGFDDLDKLYIINDSNRLFWEVNHENWIASELKKEYWIGTNTIIQADYSPLPRGLYRLVLQDYSGEKDEKTFRISTAKLNVDEIEIPVMSLENEILTISSTYKDHTIIVLDSAGNIVARHKTPKNKISFGTIVRNKNQKSAAASYYIYSFQDVYRVGIYGGPYYF